MEIMAVDERGHAPSIQLCPNLGSRLFYLSLAFSDLIIVDIKGLLMLILLYIYSVAAFW